MDKHTHTDIFSEYAPGSRPLPTAYLEESARILDEYRSLEVESSVPRYAAYDDDGIWATGDSREDALAEFQAIDGLDDDEMAQIGLRAAPMTERLAIMVAQKGYDCLHPAYGWRILPGGMLDLDEEN